MNSPQQSLASLAQRALYGAHNIPDAIDEDVALGCESADPALQIDCWGEEAGKLAAEGD
jgi:hypothetical protein